MASDKLGRIFKLSIQTSEGTFLEVKSPFTLEFTVSRHFLASANTASLVIYNLNQDSQRKIFKDPYKIKDRRAIALAAGYTLRAKDGKTTELMPIIFNGEVRQAYSVRQGTDFRTELECFDGGVALATGFTSQTITAGMSLGEVAKKLIKDMPGIENITLGNFLNQTSTRPTSLMGSPAEILKELTGNKFYIDSQQAFILDKNEVLKGDIDEITSETGLLGTPRRAQTSIEVSMIFEPRIRPSQQITLNSRTAKNFNGVYKVAGVTHRGTISGAVGGDCTTTLMLFGGEAFTLVPEMGMFK